MKKIKCNIIVKWPMLKIFFETYPRSNDENSKISKENFLCLLYDP